MGAAVGIDLGTTNTVVGYCAGGQTRILPDEQGQNLLPSVVSFHPDGRTLVGRDARRRRVIDPQNTLHSIKRILGRHWGSPEVESARGMFPFELVEGDKRSICAKTRGGARPLVGISALILARAKELASRALGEEVTHAVVTVPAQFNDLQRSATRKAAREAGLEVLRILNEPTAAALAYGLGAEEHDREERLAVYDFGGGTFDITLLEMRDNVFEVIATAGDTFLGGDDLDAAIEGQIVRSILAETNLDVRSGVESLALVRAAAEHLKIQLSDRESAEVELKNVGYGEGGVPINFHFTLTRTQLERLAKPLVDRTLAVCGDAMRLSRLEPADFSSVILVGGQSRMPYVQERVEAYFGNTPRIDWNPDEVVAAGAAIMAAMLSGQATRVEPVSPMPVPSAAVPSAGEPPTPSPSIQPSLPPSMPAVLGAPRVAPEVPRLPPLPTAASFTASPTSSPRPEAPRLEPNPHEKPSVPSVFPAAPSAGGPLLIDVTPLSLSVETVGGMLDLVVARNTHVPCARTRHYATGIENQQEVVLRVCQGEGDRISLNTVLGECVLSGLPPARRGELSIEVTFELDSDGILRIHAREERSGREIRAEMRVTRDD